MKLELKEVFNIVENNKGAEEYQRITRKRYKEKYLEKRKEFSEDYAKYIAEIYTTSYAEGYMMGNIMATARVFSNLKGEIENLEELFCRLFEIDKETLQKVLEFGNQLIKEDKVEREGSC